MNPVPFSQSLFVRILFPALLLPAIFLAWALWFYHAFVQEQIRHDADIRLVADEQALLHSLEEKKLQLSLLGHQLAGRLNQAFHQIPDHAPEVQQALQDLLEKNSLSGVLLAASNDRPIAFSGTDPLTVLDQKTIENLMDTARKEKNKTLFLPVEKTKDIVCLAIIGLEAGRLLLLTRPMQLERGSEDSMLVAFGEKRSCAGNCMDLPLSDTTIPHLSPGSHTLEDSPFFIRKIPIPGLMDLSRHYLLLSMRLENKAYHKAPFSLGLPFTAGILAFLCMTFFLIFSLRAIIRPLDRLRKAVPALARGNFHTQLPLNAPGEIGLLATAIAQMAGDLQTSISAMGESEKEAAAARKALEESESQLRDYNQNLERMVEKQTRDLRQTLDRLQNTQAQLIQSEKMASLGQLAAGVAHEINNPVGFVKSNLGTIRDYFQDLLSLIQAGEDLEKALETGKDAETALENIRKTRAAIDLPFILEDHRAVITESLEGMQRVARIVSDLKNFSRGGVQNLEPTDILQCLESTLNIVWNEIKYKAEVIRNFHPLPQVLCSPQKLGQVFMNLLVNAAHAIEKHGVITLHSRVEEKDIVVEIQDTGCGIAPEILPKIFDPFFTTKPVGKGTGLGLNISYSIMHQLGGDITVVSTPGAGSTFSVRIPLREV